MLSPFLLNRNDIDVALAPQTQTIPKWVLIWREFAHTHEDPKANRGPDTVSAARSRYARFYPQNYVVFSALAELEPADRSEDKRAWEEPEQERHDLDAEAGHHCPLVRHQSAIGLLRDDGRQDFENGRIEAGPEPGARLEFRRHRTGTEHRDTDAMRRQLGPHRLRERQHIGLGGVINRHSRPRQKAGNRADVQKPAAVANQVIGKPQRQIRECA